MSHHITCTDVSLNHASLSRATQWRQTCVNGDWRCQWGGQFLTPPPQNAHALTDHRNIFLQVIMSAIPTAVQNLMHIRPWGLLGKWVKYKKITYLFICLFIPCSGTHLQVRPVDGFSRLMAQSTRTRARMCLLGDLLILLLTLGVIYPKNNLGGVNRHFQAKPAKY